MTAFRLFSPTRKRDGLAEHGGMVVISGVSPWETSQAWTTPQTIGFAGGFTDARDRFSLERLSPELRLRLFTFPLYAGVFEAQRQPARCCTPQIYWSHISDPR